MKKNKRFLSLFTMSAFISLNLINSSFADNRIVKVQIGSDVAVINNDSVNLDASPYISNNNTMIPLRFVSNALDISDDSIYYDANNKSIYIKRDTTDQMFIFQIGNNTIYTINNMSTKGSMDSGYSMENSAIAEIRDSRTFIPFREIANIFDLDIGWEANTKTVSLATKTVDSNTYSSNSNTTASANSSNNSGNSNIVVYKNTSNVTNTTNHIINTQPNSNIYTDSRVDIISSNTTNATNSIPEINKTENTNVSLNTTATFSSTTISKNEDSIVDSSSNVNTVVDKVSTPMTDDEMVLEVIRLINVERTKNGISPLEIYEPAMVIADAKSKDMAENDYLDHSDFNGFCLFELLYYNSDIVTENILSGQDTCEDIMASILKSTTHKANILNPEHKYIGVGYSDKKWTQIFLGELEDTSSNFDYTSAYNNLYNFSEDLKSPETSDNTSDFSITSDEIREFQEEVVRLTNIERAKEGLYPLEIFEPAMDVALEKCVDMATLDYFDHPDPNGEYLYKNKLYQYSSHLGENLVAGSTTPAEAVEDLMNSPAHKVNIMSSTYKYIGVGYAHNDGADWLDYWAQIFIGELY